ncbi:MULTISPECIES: META domain-containing protein [unclassified Streptomyces]|uniref:META domain-containing protein n=1 Tax=unclassified Streptomyces TaxID=2593676 RepID=UPI0036E5481C
MDTQRLTLVVLTVLPLAVACGSETAGSGSVGAEKPVTGVHWSVDSVTVDGTTHKAPTGADVEIEDGRAAGSYGCNHFNAKVSTAADGTIRLSRATTTRMACEKPVMTFERILAGTLVGGPLKTTVSDDRLTLTTAGGDTVRLTESTG